MTRIFLAALSAIALLVPVVQAKEQAELRERVRDGVLRADKDLQSVVHPEKLTPDQREHFDAAVKDLHELQDAVTGTRWEGERENLERAVDNIDFLSKHASIDDGDKQTLGIDLYTLRSILDAWKKP
jgi:hypothetical protein